MDIRTFTRLNSIGETATFDRKLECNAFRGDEKRNAEVVKDICAMANNGARHSYIVVGVSDDGRQYKSAADDKLTEDRLRDLVKRNIYPIPVIGLETLALSHAGQRIDLKVITVGKNKRQAFRLAADLINYREKYAFHRNEVWIRRGATSDIATPEEIVRLASGRDLDDPLDEVSNVVYGHVPKKVRRQLILEDAGSAADHLALYPAEQIALLDVGGNTSVLRLLYYPHFEDRGQSRLLIDFARWGFEHGLLVLSPEKLPSKYLASHPLGSANNDLLQQSKEKWGHFGVVEVTGSGSKPTRRPGLEASMLQKALKNGPPLRVPVFVIADIKDRHSLVSRLRSLIEFVNSPGIQQVILTARDDLNIALASVVKERKAYVPPIFGDLAPSEQRPTLGRHEAIDNKRFGKNVKVAVVRDPSYIAAAKFVRSASKKRVGSPLPAGRVLGETVRATQK